jgi:hypothetical protein
MAWYWIAALCWVSFCLGLYVGFSLGFWQGAKEEGRARALHYNRAFRSGWIKLTPSGEEALRRDEALRPDLPAHESIYFTTEAYKPWWRRKIPPEKTTG